MANRLVQSITMNQVKDLVGKISQSNQYLVSFSSLKPEILQYLGGYLGINNPGTFLSRKSGLLCSEAVLPTTSYATGEVKDNFMGVPQEFAHTRLYTDIDFTFYVDTDYTNLRIFEGWMDFISSGSHSQINELRDNYYKRYRYPDDYKVQTMFISKFEKDITTQIDYQFINAFPKTMTSIPVSYGDADLLKVSVTFNYDRYIVNPRGSYINSPISDFDDIPRTFLDTRFNRSSSQSLFSDNNANLASGSNERMLNLDEIAQYTNNVDDLSGLDVAPATNPNDLTLSSFDPPSYLNSPPNYYPPG